MAELPIPFSAPMVLALLREIERPGTGKTKTRRANHLSRLRGYGPIRNFGRSPIPGDDWGFRDKTGRIQSLTNDKLLAALPYRVGDRLYVREHWRTTQAFEDLSPSQMSPADTRIKYLADNFIDNKAKSFQHFHEGRHRHGMHMPRWASRLTLIVTAVKVERLNDITREDAIAEGLIKMPLAPPLAVEMGCDWGFEGDSRHGSPVSAYAALWDSINGEGAWDKNPWIAAYTFTVLHQNIDITKEANHG